jgi:hypothetical protein
MFCRPRWLPSRFFHIEIMNFNNEYFSLFHLIWVTAPGYFAPAPVFFDFCSPPQDYYSPRHDFLVASPVCFHLRSPLLVSIVGTGSRYPPPTYRFVLFHQSKFGANQFLFGAPDVTLSGVPCQCSPVTKPTWLLQLDS